MPEVKSSPAAKDTKTTSGKQIYESIVSRMRLPVGLGFRVCATS